MVLSFFDQTTRQLSHPLPVNTQTATDLPSSNSTQIYILLQGLLRRGLTVSAMREFMISQGASKAVTNQEWGQLWTFNKTVIDPVCPRHTAVKADGKVLLRLKDMTGTEYVTLPKHKKNSAAGKKTTMRSPVSPSFPSNLLIWTSQAVFSLQTLSLGC